MELTEDDAAAPAPTPAPVPAPAPARPSGRPAFLDEGPSKVRANPLSPAEAEALGQRAPEGLVTKYLVKARATVRQSPEDESKKVGDFQPGELIECCEPVAGRVQAVTAPQPTSKKALPPAGGGWLKLQTAKGKELLEVVKPADIAVALREQPVRKGKDPSPHLHYPPSPSHPPSHPHLLVSQVRRRRTRGGTMSGMSWGRLRFVSLGGRWMKESSACGSCTPPGHFRSVSQARLLTLFGSRFR